MTRTTQFVIFTITITLTSCVDVTQDEPWVEKECTPLCSPQDGKDACKSPTAYCAQNDRLSDRCGMAVTYCTPGCVVEYELNSVGDWVRTDDTCGAGYVCVVDDLEGDHCVKTSEVEDAVCGDGTCEGAETHANCPEDCTGTLPTCGDGKCNGNETCGTCPGDCPAICGDGLCTHQETHLTCPQDCPVSGPVCGNGQCEAGENSTNCPQDCGGTNPEGCGDGICNGAETPENCAIDCGASLMVECTISCPTVLYPYAHIWWGSGSPPNGYKKQKDVLQWSTSAKDICIRGRAYADFNCSDSGFGSWDQSTAQISCNRAFDKKFGTIDPRGEGEIWFTDFQCYLP